MYRNETKVHTLDEIERDERLKEDCNKTGKVNKYMGYIRETAQNRLEDLRKEYILENCLDREEQLYVNRVFNFLKEKA